MHGEQPVRRARAQAGASGYLTKDSAAAQLVGAIRKVAARRRAHQRGGGGRAARRRQPAGDAPPHTALSDREFEVFRHARRGPRHRPRSPSALHLSVKTVSTHKARILEKMKLASTAELVRYARGAVACPDDPA